MDSQQTLSDIEQRLRNLEHQASQYTYLLNLLPKRVKELEDRSLKIHDTLILLKQSAAISALTLEKITTQVERNSCILRSIDLKQIKASHDFTKKAVYTLALIGWLLAIAGSAATIIDRLSGDDPPSQVP